MVKGRDPSERDGGGRVRGVVVRVVAALLTILSMAACQRGAAQSGPASPPSSVSDLLARIQADGKIRVATGDPAAPRSWYDEKSGTWKGFDVEVAREIAYRLGVDAVFVRSDRNTDVADGSWNAGVDMAVGSMPVNDDSSSRFALSPAYYYTPSSIAVPENDTTIEDLDTDLDGKTVCVAGGTVAAQYLSLSLHIPGYEFDPVIDDPRIETFPTEAEALDQLAAVPGIHCDAAMATTSAIERSIAAGRRLRIVGRPLCGVPLAIAFDRNPPLDNATLVESVSRIVEDMHDDDTLKALSIKWFGEDLTSIG